MGEISPLAVKEFLEHPRDSHVWMKRLKNRELDEALEDVGFEPCSLKVKPLQKHQKVCVLLGIGYKTFAFWLDMGTGKTRIALELLAFWIREGEITGALVLGKSEDALIGWEREIKEWRINLPILTLLNSASADKWEALAEFEGGLVLATYPGFARMVTKMKPHKNPRKKKKKLYIVPSKVKALARHLQAYVCDECFPAGTTILTPTGLQAIETVQLGQLVIGSKTPHKVRSLLIKQTSFIVRLALNDGRELVCTPNHPIFTDLGWTCAGNAEGRMLFNEKAVQNLWRKDRASVRERVLQSILLHENEMEKQRSTLQPDEDMEGTHPLEQGQEAWAYTRGEPTSYKSWSEGKAASFYSGDTVLEQGDTNAGGEQATLEENTEGNRPHNPRRKPWWERTPSSIGPEVGMGSIRPALGNGIRHPIRPEAAWLSNQLQSRYCLSYQKASNRSRWQQSSQHEKTSIRQEEGEETIQIRVESVSLEKLNDPITVYSLELEGSPHYYAEGLLVHNSTELGNKKSLQYRICNQLARYMPIRYELAGRPFGRDPTMLWSQLYLLDRGETLGDSLGMFRAAFFKTKENFFGGMEHTFKREMRPKLNRILRHRSIQYRFEECGTLPKMVPTLEEVHLPGEAQAYYEQFVKQIKRAHASFQERQNSFIRMRQVSSGFVGFLDDETGERAEIAFAENPKLDRLVDLIQEVPRERKFVVFHEFTYSGRLLTKALTKLGIEHGWLWGGAKNRREQQERFNDDDRFKGLIVNHKLGSMSLNLQAANYLFFYESPVPVIYREQAERRVRRKGQLFTVFQYDLLTQGTADARILAHHRQGGDLFRAVIHDPGVLDAPLPRLRPGGPVAPLRWTG